MKNINIQKEESLKWYRELIRKDKFFAFDWKDTKEDFEWWYKYSINNL